jgi:Ni,Fe-hydrogenase III large subunit
MADAPKLAGLIGVYRAIPGHRPYPRVETDVWGWQEAVQQLENSNWTLLGLWGEQNAVNMALIHEPFMDVAVVTLPCPHRHFPSVAKCHPPADRLERTVSDLFGLEPLNGSDPRPWLDHGRWGVNHPQGLAVFGAIAEPYRFLSAEGEGLHQIAVGPVHAGIIEPGHFRFHANGEIIVRLEQRLGYAHKGIEALMQGASVERAAKLAGRLSGDSTVAYAIAFARAVESAIAVEVPARAHWLRALLAELERLANHFGDIGAICNDASFALMHAHCAVLRERVLRAADTCFGHRLMRDCVFPGGVSVDLDPQKVILLRSLLSEIGQRFPALVELYDNTASLQDRTVSTGILDPKLARQFGAGGYVGRASGRSFDARRALAYPPYDQLAFEVPVLSEGDVNARIWIRIREVEQSVSLINQILSRIPDGAVQTDFATRAGEGMAVVEGFRGDILVWVRLSDDGRIARCHLRDPSWFQWPLLEAAIEGNIVADFPICNKSFNCSYSGHDL